MRSVEIGVSWLKTGNDDLAIERACEESVLDLDHWVLDSDRWVRGVEQDRLSLSVVVVMNNGLESLGIDTGVDIIASLYE